MIQYSIRLASKDEFTELGRIMFEAVQNGTPEYTSVQRDAWMPEPKTGLAWHNRLSNQTVFVAENNGSILGFIALAGNYVDLAFVLPRETRKGIFSLLYSRLESVAREQNFDRIWTHASLSARAAFSAVGFEITKRETVTVRNVKMDRFEMEKNLTGHLTEG